MIIKDADSVTEKSVRAQAGARAERDMAFYLRRAFGNHRADVLIFNDIRLQHDREIAQIDHLVIHPYGMFVIESKSVSGEIHILPDGQFVRHFGRGKKVGMPSPVLQAQRQADLLRRLLQAHKESLRERKLLGLLQGGFGHCPMEIRVAISDQGIIRGNNCNNMVCKGDAITQEIEKRITDHRRGSSLLNLDTSNNDGLYQFTKTEMERLQRFLLDRHVPRSVESDCVADEQEKEGEVTAIRLPAKSPKVHANLDGSGPSSHSTNVSTPQFLCSKCHSLNLCIQHGKYGYYFKCQDCGGNTWIDTRIDETERKGRIRKSGRQFFLVCPETGQEQPGLHKSSLIESCKRKRSTLDCQRARFLARTGGSVRRNSTRAHRGLIS